MYVAKTYGSGACGPSPEMVRAYSLSGAGSVSGGAGATGAARLAYSWDLALSLIRPNQTVYDEEVFSDELPDEILEVAGSKCWEGPARSQTISFCSGIDTCPSYPAR